MTKHNARNERIKRAYFIYLREAKGMSETSIDQIAKAISRFEAYTHQRDFKTFHIEQAKAFKQRLAEQRSERRNEPLSKATVYSTLAALKAFFVWLAGQPGYKSRISYADAEYFNLNLKDARIAKASREPRVPTLEQIRHVLQSMPSQTEVELRDRALIAFAILTGARDGAIASMKLKHIDLDRKLVEQDAREVRTKFSKSFPTFFFPVGDEIQAIVVNWVKFLVVKKLFGFDDPVFPATRVAVGANGLFVADGLDRRAWSNAGPIRTIFKEAFERAGLQYFNPHSFRNTLAQLGERVCRTPEEFKAWSQNLGHEKVLTTFSSYGQITDARQRDIMRGLAHTPEGTAENERLVSEFLRVLETSKHGD
jgi:integrase